MNLYLISQEENQDYDTFDSCVVAAETENEARLIVPGFASPGTWTDGTWASGPEHVDVELIGTALPGTAAGVVLASFNAG